LEKLKKKNIGVFGVKKNILLFKSGQNIVQQYVNKDHGKKETKKDIKIKLSVLFVKKALLFLVVGGQKAKHALSIVKLYLGIKQEVFNLKVEGENEFFANGILVHNCDALAMQNEVAFSELDEYQEARVESQRAERREEMQSNYGL